MLGANKGRGRFGSSCFTLVSNKGYDLAILFVTYTFRIALMSDDGKHEIELTSMHSEESDFTT